MKLKFAKKRKPLLKATAKFDKKIAKRYFKPKFYEYEQDRIKNLFNTYLEKQKLSTPFREDITTLIEQYIAFGKNYEDKISRILINIRNKGINSIKNGIKNPNYKDLINLIYDPFTLLAAYRTVRPKKGAMTQSYPLPDFIIKKLDPDQRKYVNETYNFPDKISWEKITTLSMLLKKGTYPWGAIRKIYIQDKPAPAKKRPISIPSFSDKIVQEAIRMVLEAIYEPEMQIMNCSFGFRASNGVKEALISIKDNSQGFTTAIEGDIKGAFPNMNNHILLEILSEKIKDKRFLKLIRKRLQLTIYDTEKEKYEFSFEGLPQGGIDSPYYWNIYMMGFDYFIKDKLSKFIEEENLKRLDGRKNPKIDINYSRLKSVIEARKKKYNIRRESLKKISKLQNIKTWTIDKILMNNSYGERYRLDENDSQNLFVSSYKVRNNLIELIKNKSNISTEARQIRDEIIKLRKQRIKIPYTDQNSNTLRYHYVRYADDFLILGNFSTKKALIIKEEIAEWLQIHRKATLSLEKTLITNIKLKSCRFLGFEISCYDHRRIRILRINNKTQTRRTAGWALRISPDRERMINRLYTKGYCDQKGFPISMGWLIGFEPHIIVERFNSVMRGFANFYTGVVTNDGYINRWLYIIRWCCIKTLAQKYNSKVKKIFKKFYNSEDPNNITIKYILMTEKDNKPNPLIKTWTLLTQNNAVKLAQNNSHIEISAKLREIKQGNFIFGPGNLPEKPLQRTPRIMDADFLERINWVNTRTQSMFDLPCIQCGSNQNVEAHHVKCIRKFRYSLIPKNDTLKRVMTLRNRKQVPLCERCHQKYHKNEGKNKLILAYYPVINLYDNRITDIERYIHKGKVHQPLPFPENFYDKGWKNLN